MEKGIIPQAVTESIKSLIDMYGNGIIYLGVYDCFGVYGYSPEGEPEIGAVRILYKEGEPPVVLYGSEALELSSILRKSQPINQD